MSRLLTLDWGIGYWALQNSCRQQGPDGIGLDGRIALDPLAAGSRRGRGRDHGPSPRKRARAASTTLEINVLDLTLGCHLAWRQKTLVTCGYAMPLDVGSEQPFDGEFRLMVNHHFGPSSRLTPTTL